MPSNNKRKLVIISHSYIENDHGGKINILKNSFDTTLISPSEPFYSYTGDFAFFNKYDFNIKTFRAYFPFFKKSSTSWILPGLFCYRTVKPDIILIENEIHSLITLQAVIYRYFINRKAKLVIFIWNNIYPTGLKGLIINCIAYFIKRSLDYYIVGNYDGKKILLDYGVNSSKISIMPQIGIEPILFSTPLKDNERSDIIQELGFSIDDKIVGFVGRFTKSKGIYELIDAISKLIENQPEIKLLCIGKGELQKYISEFNFTKVKTISSTTELIKYYKIMDVLVLPSLTTEKWKEQFGRVLIEAMSAKIPVIGSNSGAIPEVISDCGYIFEEGNIQQLMGCLLKALKDDTKNMIKKAYNHVINNYSNQNIALQTEKIFNSID